jgi:hypothetical protein
MWAKPLGLPRNGVIAPYRMDKVREADLSGLGNKHTIYRCAVLRGSNDEAAEKIVKTWNADGEITTNEPYEPYGHDL